MQVVVLLAFGRIVFGIHISSTAWAAIPVALAGCLCFLAMGFAIGSVVSNPETGDAVSNVITNPMMFLSGVFFPVAAMPAFVQSIARVLPLYYLANGLRDTTVRGLSTHACGRRHRGTVGRDGGSVGCRAADRSGGSLRSVAIRGGDECATRTSSSAGVWPAGWSRRSTANRAATGPCSSSPARRTSPITARR